MHKQKWMYRLLIVRLPARWSWRQERCGAVQISWGISLLKSTWIKMKQTRILTDFKPDDRRRESAVANFMMTWRLVTGNIEKRWRFDVWAFNNNMLLEALGKAAQLDVTLWYNRGACKLCTVPSTKPGGRAIHGYTARAKKGCILVEGSLHVSCPGHRYMIYANNDANELIYHHAECKTNRRKMYFNRDEITYKLWLLLMRKMQCRCFEVLQLQSNLHCCWPSLEQKFG